MTFEAARAAGFDDINVDLISALPGQKKEDYLYTLNEVCALNPEHISAYSLSIEEGTPFYETYSKPQGRIYLPGEELDREMYHYTKEYLAEQGYHRYEFSNYARDGFESRHNLTYWTGGEYVGFGQAAASYVDEKRFSNPRDTMEYRTYSRSAYAAFKETKPLSRKEQMEEYMFLGLRTARGISREDFKKRFGESMPREYERTLLSFYRQGYVMQKDGRIFLTDEGIDVSNILLAQFLLD